MSGRGAGDSDGAGPDCDTAGCSCDGWAAGGAALEASASVGAGAVAGSGAALAARGAAGEGSRDPASAAGRRRWRGDGHTLELSVGRAGAGFARLAGFSARTMGGASLRGAWGFAGVAGGLASAGLLLRIQCCLLMSVASTT